MMGLTMSRIHDESCRLPDDGTPQGLGRRAGSWIRVRDQPDPDPTIEEKKR